MKYVYKYLAAAVLSFKKKHSIDKWIYSLHCIYTIKKYVKVNSVKVNPNLNILINLTFIKS